MNQEWAASRKLRRWQDRAFRHFVASAKRDFMLVACPGAGKTTASLRMAFECLSSMRCRRLVVVCPTEHLKLQWAEAASAVGINLNPFWANGDCAPPRDYDGVCMTYAQVASSPLAARMLCREPTFVVLDEIHHAADDASWGQSLIEAFGNASYRLLLSGTPFRSKGSIPFVEYDSNGELEIDFEYTYGDALADKDGVCRPIYFPTYEGKMEWYNRGEKYAHTFQDQLGDSDASRRLRTALLPKSDWIKEVILDGNKRLSEIRSTHPDAGGLLVAMDISHAKALAERFVELTGERPVIAHSEDAESSRKIKSFRDGSARWIIAVKMISEGVDIPRLRIGIYATNVTTELFFRQFAGRFVRAIGGLEDQNAYLLIPRLEMFIEMVRDIQRTRRDVLDREAEEVLTNERSDDKIASTFVPISATGEAHDVFHPDGVSVSQDDVRMAQDILSRIGAPVCYDASILARALRLYDGTFAATAPRATPGPTEKPLHEQKKELTRVVRRYAGQVIEASDNRVGWQEVYTELMKFDGLSQAACTIDQLRARVRYLTDWHKRLTNG